jgi:serine/threonine-protein kinase RsbT
VSQVLALEIVAEDDRLWAAGQARRFAAELGFSALDQARLAVCVAELASNTAKHAGRGRIELSEEEEPRRGCRVRAEDHGPGIACVDDALRDGFSEGRLLTPDVPLWERRGLGVGLGALGRFLRDVRVSARPGGGLLIEAVLWREPLTEDRIEEVKSWPRS